MTVGNEKSYPPSLIGYRTSDGLTVRMPEVYMPWIHPSILESVFYLYSSDGTARAGTKAGGSGCLVSLPSTDPARRHYYAVTNKHVIEGRTKDGEFGSLVLRVNTPGGGKAKPIPTRFDMWERSESDDLAVMPIQLPNEVEYWAIPQEMFLNPTMMGIAAVGPGDDVAILGRFIAHDGSQRNKPLARFGHISMMPDNEEPINGQVGFLVECRSLSGFSGSPVMLYVDVRWRPQPTGISVNLMTSMAMSQFNEPKLLGIVSANVAKWSQVCTAQDPNTAVDPPQWVETNSGVSVVIPTWRLMDLLNVERLMAARKINDDEHAKSRSVIKTTIPLSAEEEKTTFTKDDFKDALKRVSRKLSDAEKSET